jgi:hypothetical protein
VFRIDDVSNFSPEIAVPMTVKMPEPMTAPIPREVSETGPRVFFRRVSGFSDSAISLSMDLQASAWGLEDWRDRCPAPQITMMKGSVSGR